jgi:multidrug efflux pump subunit AcrA (membrane-fusion protein)
MSIANPQQVTATGSAGDRRATRQSSATTRRRLIIGGGTLAALAAAVAGSGWLTGDGHGSAADAAEVGPAIRATNVVLEPARLVQFERALNVQGNVRAKYFATVSPRLAGVLDEILVEEGERVVAGETPLFQTDPVRLGKTVEVRRHEVEVAEHALREKQAALEKAQADFNKAEYDWNRYRLLFEKGASSHDELEEAETDYRVAAALLKHAGALVDLADAQLRQARSALGIAEKDLADALVIAPLSGHVTQRFREPGEMGTPGDAVVLIQDSTLLEVSVFLPARAYGEVTVGETMMHVTVNDVELGERVVAYKSPSIDSQLRTFEARCLLRDPPATVAPGAMAQVRVVLERREGLGVPRDAIQTRDGRTVIFVADGGRARMVPVQVGLESDGLVEVMSEQLDELARIVAVGGYFLDPDGAITVAAEQR